MRHTIFLSLFTIATLTVPVEALAQPRIPNDNSLGRQVAIELCSSCHRVTEGQPLPRQTVASFFAIANLPSTTALSLKVFLRSNHKGMPNLIVSEADTDNLIVYILSLKPQSGSSRP
jgi:mono/diheme cytochrome c family protein